MSQEQIQIPKGWELKKISDVTISHDGKRVPLNKSQRSQIQGDFPYYGASGQVDSINDYKFDGKFMLLAEDGENLNSRKKPIAFIVEGKFWVNNHAHVLEPNDEILIEYLCYYVNSLNIMSFAKEQSTRPKLNKSTMNEIPILLPSIPIQKKIVQKLDDILEQLEEKKKAVFSIIEQNKEKIDFFEKNWNSFIIDSELKKFPDSQKIILADCIMLRSGNLKQRRKLLKNGKYAVFGGNGIMGYSDEYLLEKQTIVIGRVGANCGVIHKTDSKCWVTDNALYCILKKEIDLDYLYYVLKNLKLNSLAKKNAQPVINQTQILSKQIPLPPIPTQKQIVQNIKNAEEKFKSQKSQFENIKENYENSITYVNHIQSSILDVAFSGKLVQ